MIMLHSLDDRGGVPCAACSGGVLVDVLEEDVISVFDVAQDQAACTIREDLDHLHGIAGWDQCLRLCCEGIAFYELAPVFLALVWRTI